MATATDKPPGPSVAQSRRAQRKRADARKVAWLTDLIQVSASHHSGTQIAAGCNGCAELTRRVVALESKLQKYTRVVTQAVASLPTHLRHSDDYSDAMQFADGSELQLAAFGLRPGAVDDALVDDLSEPEGSVPNACALPVRELVQHYEDLSGSAAAPPSAVPATGGAHLLEGSAFFRQAAGEPAWLPATPPFHGGKFFYAYHW